MRLIDADELKKYISNMPLTNASKEIFKNAIKAQPTVYDIDKVVEELETKLVEVDYMEETASCWNSAIEEAIEIVKRGGKV